jgi:hypothetical protein
MGVKRKAYRLLVGKPEERRAILKWISERNDGMIWIGLILIRIGKHGVVTNGNEFLGCTKC